MGLTAREKQLFVRGGFVVKHFPLDPQRVQDAIDLTWSHIDTRFDRNDPDSWVGEIEDSCRVAAIAKRRGRVKLRECVRTFPWLVDMVYGRAEILEIVQDLLGPKGQPRKYMRGLYPIFPSPTSSAKRAGGMDAHPFQICCIIYLSDVRETNCGGFTAWAGSHRLMRYAFPGKASCKLIPNYQELVVRANAEFEPVEILGPPGTTIFWHHRMLHSPSTNRGREVRHALVADFIQSDWEAKADLPHEDNMWSDWAISDQGGWFDNIAALIRDRVRKREGVIEHRVRALQ